MRLIVPATMAALLWVPGMAPAIAADATPAAAKADEPVPDPAQEAADQAGQLLAAKRPADAILVIDPALAEQERVHAGEKRLIYSAHSPSQLLAYAMEGATQKRDTVVLGGGWSSLLFLKGYALIDLGRSDEARLYLERAVAMSPMHAHYLSELGEWYKVHKDWAQAYTYFERAYGNAAVSPEAEIVTEKSRARRGMGYTLVEQGKLKEAEKAYRDCLKINPQDTAAQAELVYIRDLKAKAAQ